MSHVVPRRVSGIIFIRYDLSQKIRKPNNLKILGSKKTKGPNQVVANLLFPSTPTFPLSIALSNSWYLAEQATCCCHQSLNVYYYQSHGLFFTLDIPTGVDVYPAVGIIVNRTPYAAKCNGNCKHRSYDIQIKNCDWYFEYYLQPITGACSTAYCFGKYMLYIYYKWLVQLYVSCEYSCRVVIRFTQLTMHEIDNISSAHYRIDSKILFGSDHWIH